MSSEFPPAPSVPLLDHRALDEQHRAWSMFLGSLHQAVVDEASLSEQRLLLHEFQSHLRVHCAKEEQLMRSNEYPDRAAHAMAHQALFQRLEWFDEILVRSAHSAALEALRDLTSDLFSHVNWEDRRLVGWHRTHRSPAE